MGTSASAILVYGVPLEEDTIEDYEETEEEPSEETRRTLSYLAFSGDEVDGIIPITHCHYEYPMHIVCIADTRVRACSGTTRWIRPEELKTDPEWGRKLTAFLDEQGVPAEARLGPPGWYMASYFG